MHNRSLRTLLAILLIIVVALLLSEIERDDGRSLFGGYGTEETADGVDLSSHRHASAVKELLEYTGGNPFADSASVTINLARLDTSTWKYPLPGAKVISPYGGKRHHKGVDLKTKPNDKILATFEGVVVRSGWFSGYGNCIEIRHAYGLRTLYAHQSKNLVKKGDFVKAGQAIGLTGRTGHASTEHLHFELFCQGRRYDPARIFDHKNHKLKDITVVLTSKGEIIIKE